MRKSIFRQYDSRWGSLPYPTKKYPFSGYACGCCACTHLIIEKEKYKNYTPKSIRPYMIKQGFVTYGRGTTWNGITETLKHYGYAVKRPNISASMSEAWKELNNGNRAGVLLFKAGSRGGVTWTTGGHYVAFLDYKVKNNKHYFYTKDSGGRKNDGWHCYETTMKGLLPQIWIVELPKEEKKTTTSKPTTTKKKVESAKSYMASQAGTYSVTATSLNVRCGAGTDKAKLLAIPKGTKVKNYGYYTTVSGTKWILVQFTYKNVTYTGFCSKKYLTKV
jgi:hypothetical protein